MQFMQMRNISLLSTICVFQFIFFEANLGQSADGLINRAPSTARPNSQRKNRPLEIIANIPYADTDNLGNRSIFFHPNN